MTLVAVAPNKFARGVETAADFAPDNERKVRAAYEVLELGAALNREWRSDAHLVCYVVRDATGAPLGKQPRINKPGLAAVAYDVDCAVFCCDVDNPGHAEWTDELFGRAVEQQVSLPVLATTGVYATKHGRRILQPLAKPIPVRDVEPYLERWLSELEHAGIAVDWACRDWTRHFRLPHVRRGGIPYRSPWLDMSRARAIELAPVESAPAVVSTAHRGRNPVIAVEWRTDVPADVHGRVEQIARAVRGIQTEWHSLFLALGGALLSRGVVPGDLPAFLRAVSLAAGDGRPEDREAAAKTTVARRLSGQPVRGLRQLRDEWPSVAAALEDSFAPPVVEIRSVSALETASAELVEAIRSAGDGLTVIAAECGIGKSHALEQVALEREGRGPREGRAAKDTKTSIATPTHALAIQTARNIRARGGMVLRIFSPFALKNEDTGEFECRYAESARALVNGRQSGQWELCEGRGKEPCSFKATCRAYGGADGPNDARIIVGPHQLVGELDAAAGPSGLLGIDEPPSMLETELLTDDDFVTALTRLGLFTRRYATAMRPALRAMQAYLGGVAELDEVCSPEQAVRHGAELINELELASAVAATDVDDVGDVGDRVLACARAAHYPDHNGTAPPLDRVHVERAKVSPAFAHEIGAVSRILWAVYRALTSESPVSVRVEERGDRRHMLITMGNEAMISALRRDGRAVVLDANADVEVLTKLVGYQPPVHRFAVPDGAPIARTLIRSMSANGRAWKAHGRLVIAALIGPLRALVEWVREDPSTKLLGIITPRLVELALKAGQGQDVADEWKEAGQVGGISPVRDALAPLLEQLAGVTLVLGHYGALRGLNHMAAVDALVTLGDPWPNLGDARDEAYFLGLGDNWEPRFQVKAQAELEQAHGRLRAVQRTRPARALHIGSLLPSGSAWASGTEARRIAHGRPPTAQTMKPDEAARLIAALGGTSAAAQALGCSRVTAHRYATGARTVPPAVSVELRRLAIGVSETRSVVYGVTETPIINTIEDFRLHLHNRLAIGVSEPSPDDDPPSGGVRSSVRVTEAHADAIAGAEADGWTAYREAA